MAVVKDKAATWRCQGSSEKCNCWQPSRTSGRNDLASIIPASRESFRSSDAATVTSVQRAERFFDAPDISARRSSIGFWALVLGHSFVQPFLRILDVPEYFQR